MIFFLILLIFAYLLGSISPALLVAKKYNLPDPRTQGSGNLGATNMLRIGGKKAALYVLIGDIFKGFIPVLIARWFDIAGAQLGFIALAAVLGHIFPIYFQFKGGKGVATTLGGLIALNPILAILVAIIWTVLVKLYRYVSLGSIVAVILMVLLSPIVAKASYFIPLFLIAIVVVIKHKENILRLIDGTEPKLGETNS